MAYRIIEHGVDHTPSVSTYRTLDAAKEYLRACRIEFRDWDMPYRAELWEDGAEACSHWVANGTWAAEQGWVWDGASWKERT